jgi:CheY-like chemotaxis protein
MMPEMDGFALAERILKEPELAGVAIMMLTSVDGREGIRRCRQLGLGAYLIKPVKQSDLLDAILKVLEAKLTDGIFADPGRRVKPTASAPGAETGCGLRILLAEDNEVNQRLALRLLEKQGHSVVLAGNGKEALTHLERQAFDLVFMDVQMPEMSGLEATALIRAKEASGDGFAARGRRLPIVAMTAHAMKGDREHCLAVGMDDYIAKPIHANTIREVIGRLTKRCA